MYCMNRINIVWLCQREVTSMQVRYPSPTQPDSVLPTDAGAPPIFSFANGELGALSNGIIRGLEKVTGQPKIKRMYLDYVDDKRPNHLFWQDAVARFELDVRVTREARAAISKTGPLLLIANHPFGVMDGIILCAELSKIRQDYKIITHSVLRQAPAVMHQILPIDFSETDHALATNLATRQAAIAQIKNGGALVLFPSGGISLAPKVLGPARDVEWKTFVARLALLPNTTTVPFYFAGQNSLVYMMARRVSLTLGYSLMFREICRRIGSRVDVTIRTPVTADQLKQIGNRNAVTAYLRRITYGDSLADSLGDSPANDAGTDSNKHAQLPAATMTK